MGYDIMMLTFPVVDLIAEMKGTFPIKDNVTRQLSSFTPEPGGVGNIAITLNRMGGTSLITGPLGFDYYSQFLLTRYRELGLETKGLVQIETGGVDVAICVLDENKKHSFISKINSREFYPNEPDTLLSLLSECKGFCLSGYNLVGNERLSEISIMLAEEAKRQGKPVFFDVGPLVKDISPEYLDIALKSSYMVLMNRDEAEWISGENCIEAAARKVMEKTDAIVIAKDGGNGCFAVQKGCEGKWYPGFKVVLTDTMGCGDSFWGAIMYAVVQGFDLDTSIIFANAAGAVKATKIGTGAQVPTFAEMVDLIENNGYTVPQINKEREAFVELSLK